MLIYEGIYKENLAQLLIIIQLFLMEVVHLYLFDSSHFVYWRPQYEQMVCLNPAFSEKEVRKQIKKSVLSGFHGI